MLHQTSALLMAVENRLSAGPDKADALESSVPKFRTEDDHYYRREESAINAMMCLRTEPTSSAEPNLALKPIIQMIKPGDTKENRPSFKALPLDYKEKCLDAISESDEDIDEEPEYDDESSEEDQNSDNESDDELFGQTAKSWPSGDGDENENGMTVTTPGPTFQPHCKPSCLPVSCSYGKKRKHVAESLEIPESTVKKLNFGDNDEGIVQNVEELNGPSENNAAAAQLDQEADNSLIAENFHYLLRSYEILQINHQSHLKMLNFEKAQMAEEIHALSEENKNLQSSLIQAQQEAKDTRTQCHHLRQTIEKLTQELNRRNSHSNFLLKQFEIAFEFIQQEYSSANTLEMDTC